jgi:peptide/nickel transport system substrate-binding protein
MKSNALSLRSARFRRISSQRTSPASTASLNVATSEWVLGTTVTKNPRWLSIVRKIDYIKQPPHDLLPILKSDANVRIWVWNPRGNQYVFRPNHLHKPFDDPRARRALWYAFNQEDFPKAVVGDPEYYKTCKAMFVCETTLASESGMDGLLTSNFEKARLLLREAGYDGTPVVLMHSTDLYNLTNLAPLPSS